MPVGFDSCRKDNCVEGDRRAHGSFVADEVRGRTFYRLCIDGPVAGLLAVFVRFQGAIMLVALAAIIASVLERAILDHRREIGRQHYRIEELRERIARARLTTERLMALSRQSRPVLPDDAKPATIHRVEPLRMATNPIPLRHSRVGED